MNRVRYPVTGAIGAQATLVVAGVIGGVVTFAALLLPGMRAVEALEAGAQPAEPAKPGKPLPAAA
jgi:hypothetical protein